MRNNKRFFSRGKPKIAVVVDGENESWYLAMINRNELAAKFQLKPEIPQKKSLEDQFEKVISLADDYDEVIWIIDMDVVLKESREAKKGAPRPIDAFIKFREFLAKKYNNVTVIVNQPCIEFWLLLHFEYTTASFNDCAGAETRLKKYLPDYSKVQRYYTREGDDIYLRLKEVLPSALENSKKNYEFDLDNPYRGHSGMYLLFKKLGLFNDNS